MSDMEPIGETAEQIRKRLLARIDSDSTRSTDPSNNDACPFCNESGWLQVEGIAVRCECLRQRTSRERLMAIGKRFVDASFENYRPTDQTQRSAYDRLRAEPDHAYYLFGDYGRGKTHLAVAQYRIAIEANRCCLWRSMGEFLEEIRRAVVNDETSLVLQRIRYETDFHLFLDDIDKFKPTEFKAEALFALIDEMYRKNMRLTATSNLSIDGLMDQGKLQPGIVRRIDDICRAVQV